MKMILPNTRPENTPDSRRDLTARLMLLVAAGLAICFLVGGAAADRREDGDGGVSRGINAEAAQKYSDEISKGYDFRFGPNPFAPSNARSATGGFIRGAKFMSAARCAECHAESHTQWLASAHRNSFREPFYQKNVQDLISQRGVEFTRYCEACHNPPALFTGSLTKNSKVRRPFDDEGVSCISCHSIEEATGGGNGSYVMGEPALLIKEDGTRRLEGVTDQEILDDIPSHRRAEMRPLLKEPRFCISCHQSHVPKGFNDYKFLRSFSVGSEFQTSSFSGESPHTFYARGKATCNSCHMKKEPALLSDVSAKDGLLRSHRSAAANTAIPFFYGWQQHLAAVKKFLEAGVVGVDIFAVRRRAAGSNSAEEFIAPLDRGSLRLDRGDLLTVDVVITNKNLGHSFPPELRDIYEAYVEFTVADEAGKTLYQSGFIKPDGRLDESAHTYRTFNVGEGGSFDDKHQLWVLKVVSQPNQLQAGRSDVARYQFRVPGNLQTTLKLTASVRYRRFTRAFSDYSLNESVNYPIVTMATDECSLRVGENYLPRSPDGAGAGGPDWQRWNNYGIALLDRKQYTSAAEAFARAGELDENYRAAADVNRAMALIELKQYDKAETLLDAVVRSNPQNMRALFQQSRVFVNRGQLGPAEANLRKILEAYPRDRLSLQHLGELMKIRRNYKEARETYEQVLQIDPDDVGAHYNLMLIYRKLGLKDDARREAAIYADLKDDPAASSLSGEFLRRNPRVNAESVSWHVHTLNNVQ
jgi:tetratricopeptide (TPR) repeat protein